METRRIEVAHRLEPTAGPQFSGPSRLALRLFSIVELGRLHKRSCIAVSGPCGGWTAQSQRSLPVPEVEALAERRDPHGGKASGARVHQYRMASPSLVAYKGLELSRI